MFKDFMTFLAQYNIFGIAIGLLIATKVGTLIKGLIEDLITPLILQPILHRLRVKHIEDLSYKGVLYGKVLSTLIDFFITAFLVFLIVRYAHISLPVK
ncbi:MAG: MscL family protein [candidate division SR1 bacterium]|nr:MscL family protein [candidate division SR1 bacterium]